MITRAGELDLDTGISRGIPVGDGLDVILGDVGPVLRAQQILRKDLQAVGEFLRAGDGVQPIDLVALVPNLQRVAGSE
jgi:hypothetical protein